jgi:hypothetical protein
MIAERSLFQFEITHLQKQAVSENHVLPLGMHKKHDPFTCPRCGTTAASIRTMPERVFRTLVGLVHPDRLPPGADPARAAEALAWVMQHRPERGN